MEKPPITTSALMPCMKVKGLGKKTNERRKVVNFRIVVTIVAMFES